MGLWRCWRQVATRQSDLRSSGSTLSDAGATQSGTAIEFGSNYGNSWGLVEESDSGVSPETQIIESELFETDPGTIMIGP